MPIILPLLQFMLITKRDGPQWPMFRSQSSLGKKIDNISLDEFVKALKVFWREYETVLMHSNADLL